MQKSLLMIAALLITAGAIAQNVGINTTGNAPDASAMLDIVSSDKGILIPRVALTMTTSALPISSPVTSLIVYNSATVADVTPGFYYWNGAAWVRLIDAAGSDTDWTVSGVDQYSGVTGNVGIGITTPSTKLMVHNGSSDVIAHLTTEGFVGPDAILRFGGNFMSNEAEIRYEPGTTSDLFIVNKFTFTQFADIHFQTQSLTRMTVAGDGNVGIGIATPSATLDVVGTFQLVDGNEALGRVLTSDASGNASWQVAAGGGDGDGIYDGDGTTPAGTDVTVTDFINFDSDNLYVDGTNDRVGIGTATPGATLDVAGRIWQTQTGRSVIIGESAGTLDDGSNNDNVFVGYEAGFQTFTGAFNVAIGAGSLRQNLFSGNLTAVGADALSQNSNGTTNTAVGYRSMVQNTFGSLNTAVGSESLRSNTFGGNSTAVGYEASRQGTTGGNNTSVGYGALYNNTTGSGNTAVGYQAFNTGTRTNSSAFGNGTAITANNQVRVGNASVTSIGGQVVWTALSDKRFKKNIKEDVAGLDFILELRPVTYNMDMDAMATFYKTTDEQRKTEADRSSMVQTGFIAQEVEASATKLGYSFSGVDAPKNDEDAYGLRYAEFVVPIVKAMQEQQAMIEAQNARIEKLEAQLEATAAK
jgi:hypothetical protein